MEGEEFNLQIKRHTKEKEKKTHTHTKEKNWPRLNSISRDAQVNDKDIKKHQNVGITKARTLVLLGGGKGVVIGMR